jgi:Rieske Fe-S protein
MSRFLSAMSALVLAASLGTAAFAASSTPAMKSGGTMTRSKMSAKMHSCPKGKSWVKGYTTKKGTKVKGYCR